MAISRARSKVRTSRNESATSFAIFEFSLPRMREFCRLLRLFVI
jgi:hypothetical protein